MAARTIILLTILSVVLAGALQFTFRPAPEAVVILNADGTARFRNQTLPVEEVPAALEAKFGMNRQLEVTILANESLPASMPLSLYELVQNHGYEKVDIQSTID